MCDLKICRVCLNMDVRGYKLDEHNLRSYYEHVLRRRVNNNDGLPQWFCYECATMLHKFHKFKEKCYRGQVTLKQIAWRGNITYEAVAIVNRFSEKLVSPVGLIMTSKRVKTTVVRYKPITKPRLMEVEKVMLSLDSEDSMKHEDIIQLNENIIAFERTIGNYNETPDEKKPVHEIDIKMEAAVPLETLKTESILEKHEVDTDNSIGNTVDDTINTNNDTGNTIANTADTGNMKDDMGTTIAITDDTGNMNDDTGNMNDDMDNTDHMNNPMSSEDENIFLDIVKKAVKGESKLVFLDGIEMETIPKKKKKGTEIVRTKVQRFARPKKEYLNPQNWRKFNLNEEDAMHEFKQREFSDKYVNANYKCRNCLKGFSKIEMLMRHVKLRHEEHRGPMECRFCHMRFRQKNQLCKHIKQHYAVYQCLRCDMRFRLETSAIFHEDYHNGVTRKCKHCGEEFKHSSTYYTHLRMSHRSAHLCTVCGASFVSEVGLQQHKRIKHYDNSEEAPSEAASANTYCDKCDIKFASQAAYDEHLTHSNMHGDLTTEPQYRRINMKGNKKSSADAKEHRSKKPTTCQYCGKHFATQAACMKHHLTEHPRRTFFPPDQRHICEVCGVSLAAVSIANHMNRHTREHVYPCAICGMQFISKSSHHRHQVTHTGERPHPCPLCEKRFTQKNSMQLHYRTFHLKQPYPKRNRRKKTDEMPIMECPISRDRSDVDSNDVPPAPLTKWRPAF